MIITDTFFAVQCDRCKIKHQDQEIEFWNDQDWAIEMAENSDWKTIDDKHLCPNCYTFDDELDDYIEKTKNHP